MLRPLVLVLLLAIICFASYCLTPEVKPTHTEPDIRPVADSLEYILTPQEEEALRLLRNARM